MNCRSLSTSSLSYLLLNLLLLSTVSCSFNPPLAQTEEPSQAAQTQAAPTSVTSSVAPVLSETAQQNSQPQTSQPEASRSTSPAQSGTAQPDMPQSTDKTQSGVVLASDAAPAVHSASSPVANSPIQRDFEFTAPLPDTGKVTIRDDIRNLELDQLIAACPTDSSPYAFAESTHYRVQICSQEYDPWLPKYYIGMAKDSSGELKITNTNTAEAQQLIFRNAGYTYLIYRDGARPDQLNAYLEIYTPDGNQYAEALLYLYENNRPPR